MVSPVYITHVPAAFNSIASIGYSDLMLIFVFAKSASQRSCDTIIISSIEVKRIVGIIAIDVSIGVDRDEYVEVTQFHLLADF